MHRNDNDTVVHAPTRPRPPMRRAARRLAVFIDDDAGNRRGFIEILHAGAAVSAIALAVCA